MSINKVLLLGNVGKDPEIKKTEKSVIANLTVATSERWTDKSGQKVERTEWHNVTVFGKTAEFVEKYITKGSTIYVEGKIRMDSYDKNGETKYVTRIYADSLQNLTPKKTNAQQSAPDYAEEEEMEDMPY